MDRIRSLNLYQKCVLIFLIVLFFVFTTVYIAASARKGFLYKGAILRPYTENGTTTYSGRIKMQPAVFTVTQGKTVTFSHGDKTYGPYSAYEDPSAVPDNHEHSSQMSGVEVLKGDKVIFRGGVMIINIETSDFMLFHEDASADMQITYSTSFGDVMDINGNIIDPMEPSVYTILQLISVPELTTKAAWPMWMLAVFASAFAVVSILFPDELFRWKMMFHAHNVDQIEPTDWELSARYIGWTILTAAALIIYIVGLTIPCR